jgi:hypothetical protein
MSATILPTPFKVQPQEGALLNLGHRLLLGVSDVWLPGVRYTLVQSSPSLIAGSTTFVRAGADGMAGVFTSSAANSFFQMAGLAATKIFGKNTSEATVFIRRRHTDTTARNSSTFGYFALSSNQVLIHAPYGDGKCYWQAGNDTTGSLVFTGWTKSTSVENLVFVASAKKNGGCREIWRNGSKLASNSAAISWSPNTADVLYGGRSGLACDLEEVYLVGVVARAWSDSEIAQWTERPYCIFHEPRRLWVAAAAGAGSGARAGDFFLTF